VFTLIHSLVHTCARAHTHTLSLTLSLSFSFSLSLTHTRVPPQVLQGQEEEKTVLAVLLLVDFVITLVFRGFGALKPLPLAREDRSFAGGVWVFVCA